MRETLNGLFAQTFSDWGLVFWNDQSSDESKSILTSFPHERVRYVFSSEHSTLVRARDLALREARGEWLAFLDQDDICLPEKLAKQWPCWTVPVPSVSAWYMAVL